MFRYEVSKIAGLHFSEFLFGICLVSLSIYTSAQERMLVWSDEFNNATINQKVWSFKVGPTYETLHYFTDRSENARIEDGILKIIALEESYQGFDYTAAHLSTKGKLSWRYGRIEARMKLPHTTGFVPAFWMLPEDDIYGWWPWGGEIDIMEHPTNQDKVYGTCHTFEYSYFTGSGTPSGGNIQISDSESAFHVYAVDWTPDRIDFYVDDQKYFTHTNDHTGFEVWPFDQPFYLILAQQVGGGWVGNPDATTIFPAVLEVDYVRVYQYPEDISVYGPDYLMPNTPAVNYYAPEKLGSGYDWTVPNQAQVTGGQHTSEIEVQWGLFGGTVDLDDGDIYRKYPVEISDNILKNGSFEKGVKYWDKAAYPAEATFLWSSEDSQQGDHSIYVEVNTPGTKIWEAQIMQTNIALTAGKHYYASFWGKAMSGSGLVSAGVINATDFTVYGFADVYLTSEWARYEFDFIAPASVTGSFNISMGTHTGSYYFDNIQLKLPETESTNQVVNASFSDGDQGWIFSTFSQEDASLEILGGEANVNIATGGIYPWDIHLGQIGVNIVKDNEYTFSFDAYASGPREISAIVGLNEDPWTVYSGDNTFILLQSRQTFSFTFKMESPTDENARLGFDLGGLQENVIIDNVFLSTGELSPTTSQPYKSNQAADGNIFVFPNPSIGSVSISYVIAEANQIKLEIYSENGQLIETLVNCYISPGVYTFRWDAGHYPAGVYYCKLITDKSITSSKLILNP